MAAPTKYENWSNENFINLLENRMESPIIAECFRRLSAEYAFDSEWNFKSECPICQAPVEVEIDNGNKIMNVVNLLEIP